MSLKSSLQKIIPRLYGCVDQFPRGENTILSGWAFYSHGLVELRLEGAGLLLDRFFPEHIRTDVKTRYPHFKSARLSGFQRSYDSEASPLLREAQAKLFAVSGKKKKELWRAEGVDTTKTLPELRKALAEYFPLALDHVGSFDSGSIDTVTIPLGESSIALRELIKESKKPFIFISLPYRFGEEDKMSEEKARLLDDLLGDIPKEMRDQVVLLSSSEKVKASKHGNFPIYRLEDLSENILSLEGVVVATDCWSVRTAHTLSYSHGLTPLYADKALLSERWYEELREVVQWCSWSPLKRVSLCNPFSFDEEETNESQERAKNRALSFIIPIYNSFDSVLMAVRSILPSLGSDDELILVNDCSDSGTSEYLKTLKKLSPRITLLEHEENGGFIEACYTGYESAKSENHIVLVNSDVVFSSSTIPALRDALVKRSDAALFSPFSTGSRKLQLNMSEGETLNGLSERLHGVHIPEYPTVVTPEGQCLLIRREALSHFGFFDRVFRRGFCEESDLAMRMFLHGVGMAIVDSTVISHEQSASFGSAQRKAEISLNRPIYEARWGREYRLAATAFEERGFVKHVGEKLTREKSGDWLNGAEVVFILPSIVGGGGSLSVLQHVNEMLQRGIEARVITIGKNKLRGFPLLTEPVVIPEDELKELPWSDQRIVATFWSTAPLINELLETHSGLRGFYYVQDYEPWFYEEDDENRKLAEKTYTYPLTCIAKTDFLRETVLKNHDVPVNVIPPGIDRGVFYPDWKRDTFSTPPKFVAMYRPKTPRRGSKRLLTFFNELLKRLPEAEITLFGDTDELPQTLSPRIKRVGRLDRKDVAKLYRESSFCVDLSFFHGFGRMGIEGMACGSVPILTPSGGVSEYTEDDINSLVIDGDDFNTAIDRIVRVLSSDEIYRKLRKNAIETASKWSEVLATDAWLKLFNLEASGESLDISRELFHGSHSEQGPYKLTSVDQHEKVAQV